MARTIRKLLACAALVAVAFAAGAALADVTITMESETKSLTGNKTQTVTQYYTPTKMRHELGETSMMIMDLDEQRVITIMPASRKYFVQTFEQLKARLARMKLPETKVEIEETDEEAEIAGYTCHKVIVRTTTGTSKSVTEAWVAKDVKGIADVHAFHKAMVEAYKNVPQHWANMVAPKQFAEKGLFPLKTVAKQAGMTVTMTVTKIEEGDVDEALFEIPEGYEEMRLDGDSR